MSNFEMTIKVRMFLSLMIVALLATSVHPQSPPTHEVDIDIEALFDAYLAEHQNRIFSGAWQFTRKAPEKWDPHFPDFSSNDVPVRFQFSFDRGLRFEATNGDERFESLATLERETSFWHKGRRRFGRITTTLSIYDFFWPRYIQEARAMGLVCTYEDKKLVSDGISFRRKFGDSGLSHEIVLDTDGGLQIKSLKHVSSNLSVDLFYKNALVDGVWLPIEAHKIHPLGNSPVLIEYHYVGSEELFSAKNQPLTWEIEFPNGTRVSDETTMLNYVAGDDRSAERRNLDSLVASLPANVAEEPSTFPTSSSYTSQHWTGFIGIGVAILAGIAVAGWLLLRLRNNRSS